MSIPLAKNKSFCYPIGTEIYYYIHMKKDIHPQYYPEAKVSCACGHSFVVGSTVPEIKVEVCSNCHPFYTGKQKFLDTAGRLDRFKSKVARVVEISSVRKGKKVKKEKAVARKISKEKK